MHNEMVEMKTESFRVVLYGMPCSGETCQVSVIPSCADGNQTSEEYNASKETYHMEHL